MLSPHPSPSKDLPPFFVDSSDKRNMMKPFRQYPFFFGCCFIISTPGLQTPIWNANDSSSPQPHHTLPQLKTLPKPTHWKGGRLENNNARLSVGKATIKCFLAPMFFSISWSFTSFCLTAIDLFSSAGYSLWPCLLLSQFMFQKQRWNTGKPMGLSTVFSQMGLFFLLDNLACPFFPIF